MVGGMNTKTDLRARQLTAVRDAWLFDGTSAALVEDPLVVMAGGTVVAVGGAAEQPPDGADVVHLPGATLLPGLIDTHVHLAFNASDDPVGHLAGLDDDALRSRMTAAARRAVRGGVTTVRDLGDRAYLGVELRDHQRPAGSCPPSWPPVHP